MLSVATKSTVAIIDKGLTVLTSKEWQICCTELCKFLKPFEEVTRKISCEKYITGSQVIVFTRGITTVCSKLSKENLCGDIKVVLNELKTGLSTRFQKLENSKTMGLCKFLDPRFKMYYFTNSIAAERIKNFATELAKEIFDSKKDQSLPENEG